MSGAAIQAGRGGLRLPWDPRNTLIPSIMAAKEEKGKREGDGMRTWTCGERRGG